MFELLFRKKIKKSYKTILKMSLKKPKIQWKEGVTDMYSLATKGLFVQKLVRIM